MSETQSHSAPLQATHSHNIYLGNQIIVIILRFDRKNISVSRILHRAVDNFQPMGINITLHMVQHRMVRQFATVLTTLGLLVVLLQPPDGVAVSVCGVGHAPGAPLLAFDNVPPRTFRKGQKHITLSPGMWPRIVTARNGTFEVSGIPIGEIIIRVSIRNGISVVRLLRLLLGPMGVGSCTVSLKIVKIFSEGLVVR